MTGIKSSLILLLVLLVLINAASDEHDSPRIAIIGAGIGGSASAYHLRRSFGPNAQITVLDPAPIGGRLATVTLAGRTYEIGGTVIHPANVEMARLVADLGLRKRQEPSMVGAWDRSRFSMRQDEGGEVIFEQWSYMASLQMVLRYGLLTLIKMFHYIEAFLGNFERIYPFLDSGNSTSTVAGLFRVMAPPSKTTTTNPDILLDNLDVSQYDQLTQLGMGGALVDELATAAVRTNYGQLPGGVHAFVGAVALAGAQEGLWSVHGGNKGVAQEMLEAADVTLVKAEVSLVTVKNSSTYELLYSVVADDDNEHHPLFHEGHNNGVKESMKNVVEKRSEEFDVVIIATPMTEDKTVLKIKGLPEDPMLKQKRFHRTVATLIYGDINSTALGFSSDATATGVNFFLSGESNINSVALVTPVDYDRDTEGDGSTLPTVWKVFSQEPLSDSELEWLFVRRYGVKVADWLAYPSYEVPGRDLLGDFVLDEGLYHVNAMEWAASAMECSALAARNVVNDIVLKHRAGVIKRKRGKEESERDEL